MINGNYKKKANCLKKKKKKMAEDISKLKMVMKRSHDLNSR